MATEALNRASHATEAVPIRPGVVAGGLGKRYGRQVALGQSAIMTVDAYPNERFAGEVSFIASEAEFTPRNVQTREDRVKSVYAIKLRVPNADLRLKPGMFADAIFDVTR